MSANTRDLLDAAGAPVHYLYSAFGPELLAPAGSNPYRFGGQVGYYRDEAERLYIRAREYAPGVGRWVSRDPIVGAGGSALVRSLAGPYGYPRPHTATDPSGLLSCDDYGKINNAVASLLDVAMGLASLSDKVEALLGPTVGLVGREGAGVLSFAMGLVNCAIAVARTVADYLRCATGWCERCPADPPRCRVCFPALSCASAVMGGAVAYLLAIMFPEMVPLVLAVQIGLAAITAWLPDTCPAG